MKTKKHRFVRIEIVPGETVWYKYYGVQHKATCVEVQPGILPGTWDLEVSDVYRQGCGELIAKNLTIPLSSHGSKIDQRTSRVLKVNFKEVPACFGHWFCFRSKN